MFFLHTHQVGVAVYVFFYARSKWEGPCMFFFSHPPSQGGHVCFFPRPLRKIIFRISTFGRHQVRGAVNVFFFAPALRKREGKFPGAGPAGRECFFALLQHLRFRPAVNVFFSRPFAKNHFSHFQKFCRWPRRPCMFFFREPICKK